MIGPELIRTTLLVEYDQVSEQLFNMKAFSSSPSSK